MKRIVLAAAFLALAPAAAFAQQTPAASEEAAVAAAVRRLFDGMRAGDSAVVRAAFHPEATLRTVALRQGQTMTRTDALQGFVNAVGGSAIPVPDSIVQDRRPCFRLRPTKKNGPCTRRTCRTSRMRLRVRMGAETVDFEQLLQFRRRMR